MFRCLIEISFILKVISSIICKLFLTLLQCTVCNCTNYASVSPAPALTPVWPVRQPYFLIMFFTFYLSLSTLRQ